MKKQSLTRKALGTSLGALLVVSGLASVGAGFAETGNGGEGGDVTSNSNPETILFYSYDNWELSSAKKPGQGWGQNSINYFLTKMRDTVPAPKDPANWRPGGYSWTEAEKACNKPYPIITRSSGIRITRRR